MSWKYFFGACILSCGLLFKAGAPLPAVAIGIAAVGYLNWRKHRQDRKGVLPPGPPTS